MGQTVELMERITVNPEQCGARPCVRGMRIRVVDVLVWIDAQLSPALAPWLAQEFSVVAVPVRALGLRSRRGPT